MHLLRILFKELFFIKMAKHISTSGLAFNRGFCKLFKVFLKIIEVILKRIKK